MNERLRYSLFFTLLGMVFYLPFLGGVHLFDWDEINFAEISREMLLLGDYLRVYVNFEPFWEKPPLFFWLQALSMGVFGVGEYAARFPNAVCGVLTLPLLFNMGMTLYGKRFGLLWAGAYFGSVLPFLYFKSGIIDPWFNLFIFLGLYFFILGYWKREGKPGIALRYSQWTYFALGGAVIGLGILTKGPVAYLIAGLCMAVYWVLARFRMYVHVPQFLVFTLAALGVAALWYGYFFIDNFTAFTAYQYRLLSTPDAGHGGFPGYHFVVLLLGCFPASIFAIRAFFSQKHEGTAAQADFRKWMKVLFWVVLILFTIVRSKIVHYSSLAYFPLTFLAAWVLHQLLEGRVALNGWMRAGLWSIGGLYAALIMVLPFVGRHAEALKPLFQRDPFALGNLEAQVHWSGLEGLLPGILLFVALFVFFRFLRKGSTGPGMAVLFGGGALFTMLALIAVVKRAEGYSQRAAIEFFQSKQGEDCYLLPYGYKTYAHLFYARPQEAGKACFISPPCQEFVLHGRLDKPAYIVTKVHKAPELDTVPGVEEIYRKNGFVFLRRVPE